MRDLPSIPQYGLMSMPVMQVGVVRMGMAHPLMPMPMGMRFRRWPIVMVRVMFVVDVAVLVL